MHQRDEILGKINYYQDHLKTSILCGHECVADRVRSLYEKHQSALKVSNEMKVSQQTIFRWLKRMGVQIRNPGRYEKLNICRDSLKTVFEACQNKSEVARIFGISRTHVRRLLHD